MVLGVVLSRLGTTVIAMKVRSWESYFPSVGEIMTVMGVLAAAVLLYGFLIKWLPIHNEEPLHG